MALQGKRWDVLAANVWNAICNGQSPAKIYWPHIKRYFNSATMVNATAANQIHESLRKLDDWTTRAQWKGYDVFDGLASPLAPLLTANVPLLKQVWQQGVRRFPINLRGVLGIKATTSSKAMGFFAQGYLKLYATYNLPEYLDKARFCLQWLKENRSPGFKGFCWGNHFDYQHRSGSIAKGVPTIVWTGLIGHAFLDAYETLADESYLQVAASACECILDELGYVEYGDAIYLNYYPGAVHRIHNSNLIGASLLARVHHHSPNERFINASRRAVRWERAPAISRWQLAVWRRGKTCLG